MVIAIACILIVRRRSSSKSKQNSKRPGVKYGSTGGPKTPPDMDDFPFRTTLTAQSVSWAEPLAQFGPVIPRDRSVSCPEQPQSVFPSPEKCTGPAGERQDVRSPQPALKTEGSKKRRSLKGHRSRPKSKSDVSCHACQIQFVIFYNYYHSILLLKLVGAVNIPSRFGHTYGSYMKAELLPGPHKATTRVQYHSNNPVFEESFEFPEISSDELLTKSLKVKLFTIDRFSHSSLVGVVMAHFTDLKIDPEHPTTVWRPVSSHEVRAA